MTERVEVLIAGRVQGVWFRASTRETAVRLGLTGWVRNLPDGRVQALFEGEREALERMLAWCRTGPPGARVDHVETLRSDARGGLSGFAVLRY